MRFPVTEGRHLAAPLRRKTQVCVIGSGAGGAVAAFELAAAGKDVVVLEEGPYVPTDEFNRDVVDMMLRLYKNGGATATLGRPGIGLPLGRCIGGTTTVNSGTAFRTPAGLLSRWTQGGVPDVSPGAMRPRFEAVERVVKVQPAAWEVLGKNNEVVDRGAKAIGIPGKPLHRNAAECRGCGVCCFGCTYDAKQSMNVSYLPRASALGVTILSDTRADRLTRSGDRVTGVLASAISGDGKRKVPVEIEAETVVVAAGAIGSPVFLARNGVRGSHLGRHLHIHPATKVNALFEEEIRGWVGVPQGYYIDALHGEGLMFEGAFVPPEVGALALPFFGKRHQDLMRAYGRIANFGVMVTDSSEGRVRAGFSEPILRYDLNTEDTERLVKGVETLARIFFAAGAKEVYPPIARIPVLSSPGELGRLQEKRLKPSDLEVIAFHPTGTCRWGKDAHEGVVDPFGRVHGSKNLWVADASIFPDSLGVNPQISIMAFAMRAAEHIRAGG